jgi:hypothetical protein
MELFRLRRRSILYKFEQAGQAGAPDDTARKSAVRLCDLNGTTVEAF